LEVVRPAAAPGDAPAAQQALTAAAGRAAALSPPHDLGPYYLSDRLSDAEIVVGSAPPLPAHRLVLAVSPRFREVCVGWGGRRWRAGAPAAKARLGGCARRPEERRGSPAAAPAVC
jgi:hypothetical protein